MTPQVSHGPYSVLHSRILESGIPKQNASKYGVPFNAQNDESIDRFELVDGRMQSGYGSVYLDDTFPLDEPENLLVKDLFTRKVLIERTDAESAMGYHLFNGNVPITAKRKSLHTGFN